MAASWVPVITCSKCEISGYSLRGQSGMSSMRPPDISSPVCCDQSRSFPNPSQMVFVSKPDQSTALSQRKIED